jgi:hypothetical protein
MLLTLREIPLVYGCGLDRVAIVSKVAGLNCGVISGLADIDFKWTANVN